MVLDGRGQLAEEEGEGEENNGANGSTSGVIFDSMMIENIQNQVIIL